MDSNSPEIDVDILIIKENKLLLGLLTDKWKYNGIQVYGVPGREIRKGETIGQAVKRNIKEEFGDVLFTLMELANKYSISLSTLMEDTFKRYQNKLHKIK